MKLESINDVSFREITEKTVNSILKLKVAKFQERFVASNAVSLAQAHFSKVAWFRAIYLKEQPVGFVMIEDIPEKKEYFLWRFMIDEKYQGLGIGKQAIELLKDYVRTRPGGKELFVSYVPGGKGPENFYKKLGFKETGEMDEDEVIAKLIL